MGDSPPPPRLVDGGGALLCGLGPWGGAGGGQGLTPPRCPPPPPPGKSALHWAAAVNNMEATLALLKNGANKDMQDSKVGQDTRPGTHRHPDTPPPTGTPHTPSEELLRPDGTSQETPRCPKMTPH